MKRERVARPHRLSGLDAGFLWYDLPHQPMHHETLMLLAPTAADGTPTRITLDDLVEHIEARLPFLPKLRSKLVMVPFGLDNPLLVEDAGFDITNHVRRVVLPPPGDQRELTRLWEKLSLDRLDRNRPLWRVDLVDGLQDGRQAVFYTTHHCLADAAGFSSVSLFGRLPSDVDPHSAAPSLASAPPPARLVGQALCHLMRNATEVPRLLRRTVRAVLEVRARRRAPATELPRFGRQIPECVLNANFSFERSIAIGTLEREVVLAIKEVAGATVNDVLLAVVAGGLRRYLEARKALPKQPLIAGILVAIDPASTAGAASANSITQLATTLATDVDDAFERLQAIVRGTRSAKAALTRDPALGPEWMDVIPPFVSKAATRLLTRRARTGRLRPLVNVTVSNVPFSIERFHIGPASVEEEYGRSGPTSLGATNVLIATYDGVMRIGIAAFAEAVSDADELIRDMQDALVELGALATARSKDERRSDS